MEKSGWADSEEQTTGIHRESERWIMWSSCSSEDISSFKSSYFNKYFLVSSSAVGKLCFQVGKMNSHLIFQAKNAKKALKTGLNLFSALTPILLNVLFFVIYSLFLHLFSPFNRLSCCVSASALLSFLPLRSSKASFSVFKSAV